jgi:hypothetical protein
LPFSASWTLVAVPVAVVVDMSDEHRSDGDEEEMEEGGRPGADPWGRAGLCTPRREPQTRGPARALDH